MGLPSSRTIEMTQGLGIPMLWAWFNCTILLYFGGFFVDASGNEGRFAEKAASKGDK